jgi:hypothetical protein
MASALVYHPHTPHLLAREHHQQRDARRKSRQGADYELGLAMKKEFRGINWTFALGPKKHSAQQRGVGFLAGRLLKAYLRLQPSNVDKVSSRSVKTAVETELGEKLRRTTWQRLRDKALHGTGWKVVKSSLIRKVPHPQ